MRISHYLVSLLLSTLPRIVHHPEHDAQRIYVLFMSWCLGRSKKGYVLFFGASPVLCLFSQGKKQDVQENHTKNKTSMNMSCFLCF